MSTVIEQEYRPNNGAFYRHLKHTCLIGIAAFLMAVFSLFLVNKEQRPFFWGVTFSSLGLLFFFIGLSFLYTTTTPRWKWAYQWGASANTWFPKVMIFFRNIFSVGCFITTWRVVISLGLELAFYVHIAFYVALVTQPLKNIWVSFVDTPKRYITFFLDIILKNLALLSTVIFIAGILNQAFEGVATEETASPNIPQLILWVPVCVTLLFSFLLFLNDILSFKKPPS